MTLARQSWVGAGASRSDTTEDSVYETASQQHADLARKAQAKDNSE